MCSAALRSPGPERHIEQSVSIRATHFDLRRAALAQERIALGDARRIRRAENDAREAGRAVRVRCELVIARPSNAAARTRAPGWGSAAPASTHRSAACAIRPGVCALGLAAGDHGPAGRLHYAGRRVRYAGSFVHYEPA